MAREINLVPDIKNDMNRTLKLRNLIFFISIVVGIFSVVIIAVLGSIAGGQQLAVDSKKETLSKLSTKIDDYDDLNYFLTIRDQMNNISDLTNNRKVLSRTFNILTALLPKGDDYIKISELGVKLDGEAPTFQFDAQADAVSEPFIDYNVLDSFKKSMQFMKYDYGRYVDKQGTEIPAYCIIENGQDGATLKDDKDQIYAYWTIGQEGCNPNQTEFIPAVDEEATDEELESAEFEGESEEEVENQMNGDDQENSDEESSDKNSSSSSKKKKYSADALEAEAYYPEYKDQPINVVRIWRTPQYNEWYKNGNINLQGEITDVPHFNSECITYAGETTDQKNQLKWTEKISDDCNLVPGGESGINISDSSNGRGAGDALVLRFTATITLNPAVYNFNNFHMIAIPPSGRRNVTDSYVQVQSMFGEPARDCDAEDTACTSNIINLKGGTN